MGILSERDVARAFGRRGVEVVRLSAGEPMTCDVATVGLDDSVQSAMEAMRFPHVRHLPVVEGGVVVAMVSQRDVLASLLEQTQLGVAVLRDRVIATR